MGAVGKNRLRALLQGWVDHVVPPNNGIYVLSGKEAAVPIFNGNVMLDILMSDQAADGVPLRSRTLLSMQVCLCIGNLFLAELLQLVAWPCDMAECALICTHTLARIGSGLATPVTLIQFLEYLGGYVLGGHTTTAFRDRAALYMRNVCLGIGRLYFLSQKDGGWTASSLAMLGNPSFGRQGERCRLMPGLKKELVETAQSLRGRGVSKVSQVALGYEMVQKGGHVKRGLSLADLTPPNKIARTGGFGMALSLEGNDEVSNPREDAEALSPEGETEEPDKRHLFRSRQSYRCEHHYAWNYHLSTRFAFGQGVKRGTMSLDGTDVGNGKVVTCVVGDMDRDLHGWAPPMDPTYVIEI